MRGSSLSRQTVRHDGNFTYEKLANATEMFAIYPTCASVAAINLMLTKGPASFGVFPVDLQCDLIAVPLYLAARPHIHLLHDAQVTSIIDDWPLQFATASDLDWFRVRSISSARVA